MIDNTWQVDALCREFDPEMWFPEQDGDNGFDAKQVCRMCPVRLPCLQYAVQLGITDGIFAGFGRTRRNITVDTAAEWIARDEDKHARHEIKRSEIRERARIRRKSHRNHDENNEPRPVVIKEPAKCGTDSGYYRHLRVTHTEACADCKRAHADAVQASKAARDAREGRVA